MGYILPVDFHQYNQYQRREVSNRRQSDLALERVFRTELNELKRKFNSEDQEELEQEARKTYSPAKVYQPDDTKFMNKNHKQLAEITGKGQHFSETI
ncbi:hypothetical protein E3U55_12450 [Filobacillus milosensis]|uniref:Uncharacterized protein n=1 Tax=Filobacillus milosensis TaxID=94137 RepID=A0A4Y8IH96_9BACI|nr:hypothetical protein [Filobacillus milosensis]TFB15056.1 hypothetical protein E3U55_12450 [Filobacillus milosensis]